MLYNNTIETDSIGEAWIKCCRMVMSHGNEIHDESVRIREINGIVVVMNKPSDSDSIIEFLGNPEMLSWMKNNFASVESVAPWNMSYGQRLYDYNGVNQVEWVIRRLHEKPESKGATISLLKESHNEDGHVPCVCTLDFKIRNKKLNTFIFCRSQDILKKMYADNVAILNISSTIANALHLPVGSLVAFVSSAHIYGTDYERANNILSKYSELFKND